MNSFPTDKTRGFSLIELMIALAISSFMVFALVEVFAASRSAYQTSEGLARVQENGRFALDYLQRDIRMAGHMGCVNDQARFQSSPADFGSLFLTAVDRSAENYPAADYRLRFDMPVEAYDATGTTPGSTVNLASPAAGWTPALNSGSAGTILSSLGPAGTGPLPGTDVLVLRYFSSEGVPVLTLTPGPVTVVTIDPARWKVLASGGIANPGLFAISDCIHATVFQATSTVPTGTITIATGGLNLSNFASDVYLPGQVVVYRAESEAFYIALNTATPAQPSLFRTRFLSTPGSTAVTLDTQELVEGIENMQLLYGQDFVTNPALPPSGYVDAIQSPNGLVPVGNPVAWRRVGSVQVGLLTRSPNSAAAPASVNPPVALGVTFTPVPPDRNYRAVYESTIALRNRLYGN